MTPQTYTVQCSLQLPIMTSIQIGKYPIFILQVAIGTLRLQLSALKQYWFVLVTATVLEGPGNEATTVPGYRQGVILKRTMLLTLAGLQTMLISA